jgi:hypothetical protein
MLKGVLKPEPSEPHDLHDEARRLARLVEELRTLSPLAQTREVAIETEIRGGLPLVSVDADRIVQVPQIIPGLCLPHHKSPKVFTIPTQILHKLYISYTYFGC